MSTTCPVSAQYESEPKPVVRTGTRTLTGCLRTGDDEYVLIGKDGGTWELTRDSAQFDGHIGHTVAITGMISHPAVQKIKEATNGELKEHDGTGNSRTEHAQMTVTNLTVVSDTCQK